LVLAVTLLFTLNQLITKLNHIIISRFPRVLRTYNAIDSTDLSKGKDIKKLLIKHLQSINLSSLLSLKLKLKVSVLVMLLQNLCLKKGLCNRSYIIITSLQNYCIKGRLLRRDFNRQLQTILQIKLFLGEKDLTFTLTCKQFLVCLYFAITINKSQRQSFKQVKVDLWTPVFFYSQFYVIVS
jgi:ATP-dependent DNA helicase PIF1